MIDQLVSMVSIWVQVAVQKIAHHSTGKTITTRHVMHALANVQFVLVVL